MASFYNFTVTDYNWHREKDLYVIDNDFYISMTDENDKSIIFLISKGAITDGGSIPSMFQWFAKSWNDYDNKYNATFILHDALYASELEPKNIADDMLRSSLRDCGMDRLHASTICWCVNTFAKRHYGKNHDKNNLQQYIERTSTQI